MNAPKENASTIPERLAFQLAIKEIARYADLFIEVIEPLTEEQLWGKIDGIPNAIGTLVRHLTGNLNHYFGAGVLENGYVRDRDREFIEGDIPKGKMGLFVQTAKKVGFRQSCAQIAVLVV
ncbi:MAG: DUF1572 family protein [Anaerolineae bacterium]|nr:DUF1572 family protein [Anaerolineae bacterium]